MLGSIIGAVSSIAGGLLGARSAENAKDANVAMSAADREQQERFAKEGVRWRVDDAKAAGISPLVALGMSPVNYSPTAVGINPDNSLGAGLANAGQNIGRAIDSTRTQGERDDALYKLSLERGSLQNDLLRMQLAASQQALLTQGGGTPAMPGSKNVLDEITFTRAGDRSTTAARAKPAVTEFINKDGSVTIWPSKDAKEAIEDNVVYEAEHIGRNRLFPWFSDRVVPAFRDVGRFIYNGRYPDDPYYNYPRERR